MPGKVPAFLSSMIRRGPQGDLPENAVLHRGHTVGLTLWGESAEVQGAELEQSEDAIISISNCRVGEFNGAPTSRSFFASPVSLEHSTQASLQRCLVS